VIVTAAGFAPATVDVSDASAELRIALEPAPFFEAVNVTSSRTDVPRADPTVTVTVIPASVFSIVRFAVVAMLSALRLAAPSWPESAIEKQAACAAAISSSGSVLPPDSKRLAKV